MNMEMNLSKMFEGFLKSVKESAMNTPCYSDMFPNEQNIMSFDLETSDGEKHQFTIKDFYCLAKECECNAVVLKVFDKDDDVLSEFRIGWHKDDPDYIRSFEAKSYEVRTFLGKIMMSFFATDLPEEENKLIEAQRRYAHVRKCVDSKQQHSEDVVYH